MLMPLLSAGVLAAGVFFMFYAGFGARRDGMIKERLGRFANRPRTLEEIELSLPFAERVLKPMMRGMAHLVARYTPRKTIDQLRANLAIAGNPRGLSPTDFLGIRGLAALGLGGLLFLVMFLAGSLPRAMLFGLVGLLFGFLLPNFWLKSKMKARQGRIVREMPDAIDLLCISVEAGLGFDAAMQRVADKWDNAISHEFRRVVSDVRLGVPRREALRELKVRTGVPDLGAFVAAIIQADQLGVSIAKVLRVQSDQMRMRRRQRAEQAAHKAPVKMLFPLVIFIFPALFVIILGPAVPGIMQIFK